MKYSYMLLVTLVVSLIWGLLLFALGCVIRFNQAMLLNNYVSGLDSVVNLKACEPPGYPDINVCATKLQFDDITIAEWVNKFGAEMIINGFIIVLMSVCGFVGTLKRSQALLILMLVLIIVAIGLEYYILDIILDGQTSFHDDARSEMKQKLGNEYSVERSQVSDFVQMWNSIMLTGECCGVNGAEDFNINVTIDTMLGNTMIHHKLLIPPACCDRETFLEQDDETAFSNVMRCAADSWAVKTIQSGCYNRIHTYLYSTYGTGMVAFLMFLILWEGVQGILLFMIILRPPPKSPRKSKASSSDSVRSAKIPEPPKQKKFIPFSKLSSFGPCEVGRIKSTEIW